MTTSVDSHTARPATGEGYGSAAPLYWDAGWEAPLPLPSGQKYPPPPGFTGHDGAVPTPEQVSAWRLENPDGNLCLRMPEGVVGIDVDGYGQKTGMETLAEAEHRRGPLPPTYCSTSRGDGSVSGIRVFRVPPGTYLRTGITFPEKNIGDIDLIQRHHRYLVAWPSVHPETGNMYRWYGPDGQPMPVGAVPRVEDLPDLPEPWVQALSKDVVRSEVFDGSAPNRPRLDCVVVDEALYGHLVALEDSGEPDRVVAGQLDRAVERLMDPEGSRHDNTRDDVARLMRLHDAGRAGVPQALTQLQRLFVLEVGPARGATVATAEFQRLVEGAAVLIAASGVGAVPINGADAVEGTYERLTPGGSFIFDGSPDVDPLWGTDSRVLWAHGEGLMVAGPQGLGKTTLAQQVALTLSGLLQEPVLGLPIVGRKRVLYLAMDRSRQILRSFRRTCCSEDRELLNEWLVIWPGPPPKDLAKNPVLLTDLARQANADVVIVDSLKDAALGLSEDEVGAGWNRAVQHLLASGRDILVLHHIKKQSGAKSSSLDEIYGSTWLTSGMGSIINLRGTAGDSIIDFTHDKAPMSQIERMKVHHDRDAGLMSPVADVDLVAVAREEGGITVRRAAQLMFGDPDPVENDIEKARRKLDALVKRERMVKERHGAQSMYRATE